MHIHLFDLSHITYPPFCVAGHACAMYSSMCLCKFPRSIKAEVSALWKLLLDQCDWNTKLGRPTKGKGKVIPYRPGVAQRVVRGIDLLLHDRGTRRGWMVSRTPQPHFTPGKDPVPILQGAGWAPGPVWTGGKSRPHRDSIPDRPARSHSLYLLSYRAYR